MCNYMVIPISELVKVILNQNFYVCYHLDAYPVLAHTLSCCPNDILLKQYGVIYTTDRVLRNRQCAVNDLQQLYHLGYMKIEQILGYSASDIATWDDATLIKHCEEHFKYTRPIAPLPAEVKSKAKAPTHDKEKDALDGIVDMTAPVKKKRKTATDTERDEALKLLQSLLGKQ